MGLSEFYVPNPPLCEMMRSCKWLDKLIMKIERKKGDKILFIQ